MNLLFVFLGGGIGASLRYLLQLTVGKHEGIGFPINTFLVNILGCFVIGILASMAVKLKWNEAFVLFLLTGILGGFTTFSSFALEFNSLIKSSQLGLALAYVGLSNVIGLGVCGLGYYIVK